MKKTLQILSNTYNLEVRTVNTKLDIDSSLRFVQISDLHVGNVPIWYVRNIVDTINNMDIDFVVFTGDIVGNRYTELTDEVLTELDKLKYQVFAILGNHDYDLYTKSSKREKILSKNRIIELLENRCGWTYLINQNLKISDELFLVGTDDFGTDKWSLNRGNIRKAMKGVSPKDKCIVLTHNPTYVDEIIDECFPNMILCGHTHAGQLGFAFKLFGRKFEWSFASHYKYWKYKYFRNFTTVYVNAGVGWDVLPLRTFRPEITVHKIN